ncbi:type II toxin-antitoxin system VapC family toxin [Pseudoxanthomonas spadix]|uniref:type II toxin-antitoxin system VapC family toxin n=1 Tax=Pseudoxanthomonas spadix TaxID=415229 RepID=UPI000EFF384C|nr:hypothetical protein [Pseudoxanthomonas spadix]MBP3973610.1 hypothetical protein [Pseudoxanthomonas spadix]RMW94984.1 hypothetical protein D9R12_11555 [Pseudoxanthomonas spadix]
MDVLVDTLVWVDHFRHHNAALVSLMSQDKVLIHPFVLTELACGTPPAPRKRTLADLALLRMARQDVGRVLTRRFWPAGTASIHACAWADAW